jgi:hypothetical protein
LYATPTKSNVLAEMDDVGGQEVSPPKTHSSAGRRQLARVEKMRGDFRHFRKVNPNFLCKIRWIRGRYGTNNLVHALKEG